MAPTGRLLLSWQMTHSAVRSIKQLICVQRSSPVLLLVAAQGTDPYVYERSAVSWLHLRTSSFEPVPPTQSGVDVVKQLERRDTRAFLSRRWR